MAPNGYGLTDLGSSNGTFLNRAKLEHSVAARLHDGDVIAIGPSQLRFRLSETAANSLTERKLSATVRRQVLVVAEASVGADGLRQLIETQAGFAVAGLAADASSARKLHATLRPDVVIVDASGDSIGMLSLIRDLIAANAETRTMVLVERPDSDHITRLMRAGALGCVLRTDPPDELVRALISALAGSVYLSRRVAGAAMRLLAGSDDGGRRDGPAGLTDRELEIFHLIGAGRPNREIATALGMSVKTVETHKENLKVKLGLATAAELAERARKWVAGKNG